MELLRTWLDRSPLRADHIRLTGRVRYDAGSHEEFWFEYPADCAAAIATSDNPWLMALAPLAMHLNEPLRLPLPVDGQLLANMNRLVALWCEWFPNYKPIQIEATPATVRTAGRRLGSCFSGGMDSYYTLLRHEPAFAGANAAPADDLICIWGFGIRVTQPREYESVLRRLRPVAERFGKRLLTPATNLRSTRYAELPWGYLGHGPALAAVALGLENRFSAVRIPASFRTDMKIKWGSNSDSVPLFSSSSLTFTNDGEDAIRTEKTALVARCPEALATLHVCWQDQSDKNCGRCDKCLRTMLALEMLGKLQGCPAFPAGNLSPDRVARIFLPGYGADIIAAELKEFGSSLGRGEIVEAIETARQRSAWIRRWGNFGLKREPRSKIVKALSRRATRFLLAATGGIGRV